MLTGLGVSGYIASWEQKEMNASPQNTFSLSPFYSVWNPSPRDDAASIQREPSLLSQTFLEKPSQAHPEVPFHCDFKSSQVDSEGLVSHRNGHFRLVPLTFLHSELNCSEAWGQTRVYAPFSWGWDCPPQMWQGFNSHFWRSPLKLTSVATQGFPRVPVSWWTPTANPSTWLQTSTNTSELTDNIARHKDKHLCGKEKAR